MHRERYWLEQWSPKEKRVESLASTPIDFRDQR